MDPHDPLKLMTLTKGRGGSMTEPVVKTFPAVIIGASVIAGVGFILFREFVYLPKSPIWKSWLKLAVATAIGGIATHLLLNAYEYNHQWEHGSKTQQINAIKATRNFK